MNLQLHKLLDALASNVFVLNNASFFEKVPFPGKPKIEKTSKKTDHQTKTEELMAQLSQENEKLKKALETKDQLIEKCKTPDNPRITKNDFKLILEGVADGLLLVNDEGKVKFINSAAEKLFARPKSELMNYFLGLPIGDENTEVTIYRPGGHSIMAEMRVSSITWQSKTAYVASFREDVKV